MAHIDDIIISKSLLSQLVIIIWNGKNLYLNFRSSQTMNCVIYEVMCDMFLVNSHSIISAMVLLLVSDFLLADDTFAQKRQNEKEMRNIENNLRHNLQHLSDYFVFWCVFYLFFSLSFGLHMCCCCLLLVLLLSSPV